MQTQLTAAVLTGSNALSPHHALQTSAASPPPNQQAIIIGVFNVAQTLTQKETAKPSAASKN